MVCGLPPIPATGCRATGPPKNRTAAAHPPTETAAKRRAAADRAAFNIMASVTTKSARSLRTNSRGKSKAAVTLSTRAAVGDIIEIEGMDLEALVQETADLAADDIMEDVETGNAGLAPPKRKMTSPRAADFGQRYFDGRPVKELTKMELLIRDARALRDERRMDREMARKFCCATYTGYFLGFLSVVVMVPLVVVYELGRYFLKRYEAARTKPEKVGRVAPLYAPRKKKVALYDLTARATAAQFPSRTTGGPAKYQARRPPYA